MLDACFVIYHHHQQEPFALTTVQLFSMLHLVMLVLLPFPANYYYYY